MCQHDKTTTCMQKIVTHACNMYLPVFEHLFSPSPSRAIYVLLYSTMHLDLTTPTHVDQLSARESSVSGRAKAYFPWRFACETPEPPAASQVNFLGL